MEKLHGELPITSLRIELEGEDEGCPKIYRPGEEIEGSVFLKASQSFACSAFLVCLEGKATTSYRSGFSTRTKTENLLKFQENDWVAYFIVGQKENITNKNLDSYYIIKKSDKEIRCPFNILIQKVNPLPGTFKGTFGEIVYKVFAYILPRKNAGVNMKAVRQTIIIESYLNIETMPMINNPISFPSEQSHSVFSNKKLKFSLIVFAGGYIPGDTIKFCLKLNNPSKRNVSQVSVALISRVNFTINFTTKCNGAFVAGKENNNVDFDAQSYQQFVWEDNLHIPVGTSASFDSKVIKRQYYLKAEIFESGKRSFPILSGEVPIIIGSVREMEASSAKNYQIAHSLSTLSIASSSSASTIASVPPSYNCILTRPSSMETLPPCYDDIFPARPQSIYCGRSQREGN